MRRKKIICKSRNNRGSIRCSSGTTAEMLDAFENALSGKNIQSATCVNSTEYPAFLGKEVNVYSEDYNDYYKDIGGGFGEPGAIYRLADIKAYWNEDHDSDPSLEAFDSFDSWWADTRDNFLVEI